MRVHRLALFKRRKFVDFVDVYEPWVGFIKNPEIVLIKQPVPGEWSVSVQDHDIINGPGNGPKRPASTLDE
jgi:hypothetical protein